MSATSASSSDRPAVRRLRLAPDRLVVAMAEGRAAPAEALGPPGAAWVNGPVRLALVRSQGKQRSVVHGAAGPSGLVVVGAVAGADGDVPVLTHPDPSAIARVAAEVISIKRTGAPPIGLVSPMVIRELLAALSARPDLEVHWVRLGRPSGWRPVLGAVTSQGCGWSLVEPVGDGLLALRPSDPLEVWTRLCRFAALVAALAAGEPGETGEAARAVS